MSATKRGHDRAEGDADDDRDGQVDHVPAHDELLELLQHAVPPCSGFPVDRGGYPTPMMAAVMNGRVVILGGGSTGEAARGSAARRSSPRRRSRWSSRASSAASAPTTPACPRRRSCARPRRIAAARLVPGAAEAVTGAIDVERAFWHRDQVTGGLDDSSQEDWLAEPRHRARARARARRRAGRRRGGRAARSRSGGILIATGSVPTIPPIPGLAEVELWTNREATSTHEVPDRLIVIGAGPVGCELAQAFAPDGVAR